MYRFNRFSYQEIICRWISSGWLKICFLLAFVPMVFGKDVSNTWIEIKDYIVKAAVPSATEQIELEWNFKNIGEMPLVVEGIHQGCGCLSAKPIDEAIAPGSEGRINALFNAGTYRGLVRKSFHVKFAGYEESIELIAEVTVPRTVELSAQELVWYKDEVLESKTFEIRAGGSVPVAVTGLAGAGSEVDATLEALTPGKHYRVTVKPPQEEGGATRVLQIRTDSPDSRDRIMAVFLITGATPPETETPSQ